MSIISVGQNMSGVGSRGLELASRLEQNRNNENRQLALEKKQQQMGNTATGAMVGGYVGGPVGIAIGGMVGYLMS